MKLDTEAQRDINCITGSIQAYKKDLARIEVLLFDLYADLAKSYKQLYQDYIGKHAIIIFNNGKYAWDTVEGVITDFVVYPKDTSYPVKPLIVKAKKDGTPSKTLLPEYYSHTADIITSITLI